MDSLILSRLKHRVERGLVNGLLLSVAFSTLVVAPVRAQVGEEHTDITENREPEPWPQVNIPAHSDYAEAKTLLNQHKWEEAAIVLRSVLKRNPSFALGAIELARALVYVGRREEALTHLSQTALRVSGARKDGLIARSRVIARMFLTQKTFQIYQDGLNQLQQQKFRAARERFEKALESEPDNVEILTRIGQCLVLDGDYDSAAERLRLAKRLDSNEPEVSLWLGRALHQRGEVGEAVSQLKFATDGLTPSERAPLWYAEALMSAGNRKGAVQVLEEDSEERPFHLAGMVTLARMRVEIFHDGSSSLWSARKDLQVALSRLPQYAVGEGARSEGELGVEMHKPAAELKTEITALLAQLDGRLRDTTVRNPGTRAPKR